MALPHVSEAAPVQLGRAASEPPEITVSFGDLEVVASNLTPSGEAVFFSVAREPRGYFTKVVRSHGIEVADGLGEARFVPESEPGVVPLKSVWAVVDISTGGYAVGAPPGFRLREIPFPGQAFQVGAPGLVNRLRNEFEFVDMLLVRPGVGAWHLRAFDTGPHDQDGSNDGRATTAVEDMEPLGTSPAPPDRFSKDDVLVVVDPRTLAFYSTRLLGAPSGVGGLQ